MNHLRRILQRLNRELRAQNWHILLLLDNFKGHYTSYEPSNIKIEFLEPNMTSHIQPLDAGIIRSFKAHYRAGFCQHALELDEAGQSEIWKVNIKEGMEIARSAWRKVTAATISNCWAHAAIVPAAEPDITSASLIEASFSTPDEVAEAFLHGFTAAGQTTRDEAAQHLHQLLGNRANEPLWQIALNIANDADASDEEEVTDAQRRLHAHLRTVIASAPCQPPLHQVVEPLEERELAEHIAQLKARNRIFEPLSVEEFLGFQEEDEIGEQLAYETLTEEELVAAARRQLGMDPQLEESDEETKSEAEEAAEEDRAAAMSDKELVALLDQVTRVCTAKGIDNALEIKYQLNKARTELQQRINASLKQVGLSRYFTHRLPNHAEPAPQTPP